MATAFLDVQMTGQFSEVYKMLAHLDSCFSPMGMTSFMHGDVVPWLAARARNRFGQGGDDASGPWAPLRPATVEIRSAGIARGEWAGISPTHPINVRTHLMEDYITQGVGDIVNSVGSTALYFPKRQISTKQGLDKKIKTAQQGKTGTVKRPVLVVSETDLTEIVTSLAYFIQRGPQRA